MTVYTGPNIGGMITNNSTEQLWSYHHDLPAANWGSITTTVASIAAGYASGKYTRFGRGIINFNMTGFLGTSSATLRLYFGGGTPVADEFAEPAYLRLTLAYPSNPASLAESDYDVPHFGVAICADIALSSISPPCNLDVVLNADGLAALNSGWVSIGSRIAFDADDSPPTWAQYKVAKCIFDNYFGTVPRIIIPDVSVQTDPATNITNTTARLHGTLLDDVGNGPITCSLIWSQDYSYSNETTPATVAEGNSYQADITGLDAGYAYHFMAKAVDVFGNTAYGSNETFYTTDASVYPTVSTTRVSAIIHRWTPGSYTMEVSLGGLGGQFTPPFSSRKPTPILTPDSSGNISNLTRQDYEHWLNQPSVTVEWLLAVFGHFPTFEEWAFWVVANR